MKRILLCAASLFMASCAVPEDAPPGMPLDRDHRDETEDLAITKLTA